MNYELLLDIIEQLSVIYPLKARKLDLLVGNHFTCRNEKLKKEIEKKINGLVYSIFTNCLTKDDKNDFYNTSACINEECYSIEEEETDKWYIFNDGARRFVPYNDGLREANYIPREYKKGFHLLERAATTEEEEEDIILELRFLKKHKNALADISKLMDHKEELITYNYRVKNSNIPRFFVEMLVDYLGFRRIPQEEKNNTK